jgi:hypothetical protein
VFITKYGRTWNQDTTSSPISAEFRKLFQTIDQDAEGQAGATMGLHTWSQMLEHHPHVHCVMPGGAVSPQGTWIESRAPKRLFDYRVVSRSFRGKFLDGLKRLHAQADLRLAGKLSHRADRQAFELWLKPLYR